MVWLRSDKEDLMELHTDQFKILTHLEYFQIRNTDQFKILTNWKQMLINWNALASTNVNWTSCTFAAEWGYFKWREDISNLVIPIISICICTCIWISICIFNCICICIYISNVNWAICTFAAEWAYFQGKRKFQTWHFSKLVSPVQCILGVPLIL